jgi:hypothetical protein
MMRLGVLAGLLLLALPAAAQDTVVLEGQTLQTTGVIVRMQNGDASCLLEMKDAKGETFFAPADFELCKPELVGKRVRLTFEMGSVVAAPCRSSVTCKASDRIPIAVSARPL